MGADTKGSTAVRGVKEPDTAIHWNEPPTAVEQLMVSVTTKIKTDCSFRFVVGLWVYESVYITLVHWYAFLSPTTLLLIFSVVWGHYTGMSHLKNILLIYSFQSLNQIQWCQEETPKIGGYKRGNKYITKLNQYINWSISLFIPHPALFFFK